MPPARSSWPGPVGNAGARKVPGAGWFAQSASQNRAGHPEWKEHLRGRIAWAAQLNAGKAARLQRLFEQIDWAA